MSTPRKFDELIAASLAIEAEAAQEAGELAFMCRAMAQATMPHRKTEGVEFVRTNGSFSMSMMSPATVGLPYGAMPRLLIAWLTTRAVQTGDREIELGNTLSAFMREIGLTPTGGKKGTIPLLRNHMQRLFAAAITCTYTGTDNAAAGVGFMVADGYSLWWDTKRPDQASLWDSKVVLSQRFFDEVTGSPIPVDMRALSALRKSPLAIDIYTWLTYRMSYLKRPTMIPWEGLQAQFGAGYTRTRDFRRKFIEQLRAVSVVYPEARLADGPEGMTLHPSRPHVGRR